MASMALRMRLSRTCWIWIRSASTSGASGVEIESDPDALLLGSHESKGARLLDQLRQVFDMALALPAGHELAQVADDLPCPQGLLGGLVDRVPEHGHRLPLHAAPGSGGSP